MRKENSGKMREMIEGSQVDLHMHAPLNVNSAKRLLPITYLLFAFCLLFVQVGHRSPVRQV